MSITPVTRTPAQSPGLPEVPEGHDKLIVDSLKDIHNRGADLYNSGDAAGGLRMYQGALLAIRPFLAHRPEVQKIVDDGLAEVARSSGLTKAQAFHLHEVIEQVRKELKKKPAEAVTRHTDETRPEIEVLVPPRPVTAEDTERLHKSSGDSDARPKDDSQTTDLSKVADSAVLRGGAVSGILTLNGKPVSGAEITFVSIGLGGPHVFSATTHTDGSFLLRDLRVSEYVVMVTPGTSGFPIPNKYQMVLTSGLTVSVTEKTTNVALQLVGS